MTPQFLRFEGVVVRGQDRFVFLVGSQVTVVEDSVIDQRCKHLWIAFPRGLQCAPCVVPASSLRLRYQRAISRPYHSCIERWPAWDY